MGKRSIQHLLTIILIGSDPNDNKDDIKKEILKRVNEKEHRVKDDNIVIQMRGLIFPEHMNYHRQTMAMTVMVHRMRYSEVTDALLGIVGKEVTKHEFPVTYDMQMEDIRVKRIIKRRDTQMHICLKCNTT